MTCKAESSECIFCKIGEGLCDLRINKKYINDFCKFQVFGSFGLSTKKPHPIMLCPSFIISVGVSVGIGISIGIICAHLS